MNIPDNKHPASTARAVPYPDDVYDQTTDPDLNFWWWVLVIGFNLPILIFGITLFIHFSGLLAFFMFRPMLVAPIWNIIVVLIKRHNMYAKVRWWALLVIFNIYIGLYGLLDLAGSPSKVTPVLMMLASLAGIYLARPISKKDL